MRQLRSTKMQSVLEQLQSQRDVEKEKYKADSFKTVKNTNQRFCISVYS